MPRVVTHEVGAELLPVDGKDEDYERVRQNVEDIETQLNDALSKYKKQLEYVHFAFVRVGRADLLLRSCKTLVFKDIGTKDIYQVRSFPLHAAPRV